MTSVSTCRELSDLYSSTNDLNFLLLWCDNRLFDGFSCTSTGASVHLILLREELLLQLLLPLVQHPAVLHGLENVLVDHILLLPASTSSNSLLDSCSHQGHQQQQHAKD